MPNFKSISFEMTELWGGGGGQVELSHSVYQRKVLDLIEIRCNSLMK